MASRELAIILKAIGAAKAARDIGKVEGATKRVGAAGKIAAAGVAGAAGLGAVIVGKNVRAGIESLAELEDATTSVDGAISTLGLTGQVTSGQIATWANEIESNTDAAFDDKAIVSSTETLLRYGKLAPKNIRPAMEVMTDLGAKTGDVDAASTQLAKALADPAKAAGKLARVGVILTDEQQKQIKAMADAGDMAGAQAVLLDALAGTTKGAAKAMHGPYRDSMLILQDVTEDAQRALGEGFMPVIMEIRDILTSELAKPGTINNIRELGKGLAGGVRGLVDIAKGLPWAQIGDAFKLMGQGSKAALDIFTGMPPWVQTAVLTGWGLNKITGGALGGIVGELGKGLIRGVLGINAGVVNVNGPVAGAGAGAGGGGLASKLGMGVAAGVAVQGVLDAGTIATGFQQGYQAGEKGDLQGVVTAQKGIFDQMVLLPPGVAALGSLITGMQQEVVSAIQGDVKVKPQGMSPDERQEMNDLQTKTERQRTAVERAKSSIDWSRQAAHADTSRVVAAINALDLSVTVPVTVNTSTTLRVSSGSNITKTGTAYGSGPGGAIL